MKKLLFLFGLLIAGSAFADTAFNTFVPALPAVATPAGTDVLPEVQAGTTKKITVTQLVTFINANGSPNLNGATGTLQAAQFPALSGDVATSAGSVVTTIQPGAVTLAKQANLAATSVECNTTVSPAPPTACTTPNVSGGYNIIGLNAIMFPAQDSTPGNSIAIGPNAAANLTGSFPYHITALGANTVTGAGGVNNTNITAFGFSAAQNCCTGVGHAVDAFGAQALQNNTTGDGNGAFGLMSCLAVTTGNHNFCFGNQSFAALTTGSFNVGVGRQVGPANVTTGNHNILIGTDNSTDIDVLNGSNFLNIGNLLTASNLQNNDNTGGNATLTIHGPVILSPATTIANPNGSSVTGLEWSVAATTINDTSSLGGTQANYTAFNIGSPTYTATVATTATNAVTLRLATPVCGTNVTCTNKYALVAGAAINVTSGNVNADGLGFGFAVKEGSNAKQGTCTLVAGTCTVSTTAVTANSRIFLTAQSFGTITVGQGLGVSARTPGTSFVVTSGSAVDTSVVAWEIFEPAP